MSFNIDFSQITDLKQQLIKLKDTVSSKDGMVIDLTKEKTFLEGGPFLHQKTDAKSEQESAAFERDNKELFTFLLALEQEIDRIL